MSDAIRLEVRRRDWITANQRHHYHERGRRVKVIRTAARIKAEMDEIAPRDRARILVVVRWPDRRRRDVHNLFPTIKAAVDGLVDAGVLPDDDDTHLIGPDLRVDRDTLAPKDRVVLTMHLEEAP